MKRLLLFILFGLYLLFVSGYAGAEEPVPVRKEPRHKVVLENEYVRLFDVHIKPGDTTLKHIHAAPSVIVFLTKSIIGTQIVGEQPSIGQVSPGNTSFVDYAKKPITHMVWNPGTSVFHVMDIELAKKNENADSCPVLQEPGIQLARDEKLARVYNLDITAGKLCSIQPSECAHLLIDISGTIKAVSKQNIVSSKYKLTEGEFTFFPPQTGIQIGTDDSSNVNCVMLELK